MKLISTALIKKLGVASLISCTLATNTIGFATNSLDSDSIKVAEDQVESNNGNVDISPFALLIDQEVNFYGEGSAAFTYRGGGLRFFIQNTGNKSISYMVGYPNGGYLIGSPSFPSRLNAGEHATFSNLLPTQTGKFTVYVYNDDGSKGSFRVSARSLD